MQVSKGLKMAELASSEPGPVLSVTGGGGGAHGVTDTRTPSSPHPVLPQTDIAGVGGQSPSRREIQIRLTYGSPDTV